MRSLLYSFHSRDLIFTAILLSACNGAISQSAGAAQEASVTVADPSLPTDQTQKSLGNVSSLPDAPLPAAPAPVQPDNSRYVQIPELEDPVSAWSRSIAATLPPFNRGAWSASTEGNFELSVEPPSQPGYVPLKDCPTDETRARECRMHWGPMVIESLLFNAFDNAGNIYTGYWYRHETLTGKWWDRYIASAAQWRWDRWSDNNPMLDDYVAHPVMGAISNSIWIQNVPK